MACGNSGNSSNATPAATKKLVLTGSSTIAPLASELAKRYESQHADVRIDVQSGGSSRGIVDARQGSADIGMVSRSLKPDEKDLQSFTIAQDGVAIILNKTNGIADLSNEQIVGIYTKKITNWKEVGGKDAPITVVNKAEGRSTLELFASYFKLETKEIKADSVIGENEQAIKLVAGNPDAIAYVSIGTAEYEANQSAAIKLLPMRGIEASTANILNGQFPLSRPLNLVTKTTPMGLSKEFIDFAQSKANDDIVKAQYFVPFVR
ncbi:MAG: phosphate ABC transporter substrate-binding protein [Synechococcales cyanobacterium RU_4_20]|nr:phosphate ABC transporter substrate-binding protein [Synechococcales cyanobacterium RU_4_20]NJR70865.1 phosphate ABC transporter substrate-binding protein [Synechococcales cyanobacterium CRU_2_2]